MKDSVVQVTGLDGNGYKNGRYIFLLKSLDNCVDIMKGIIVDKTMDGTYTVVREVQYGIL